MFPRWSLLPFSTEHIKRPHDLTPRIGRVDYIVHVPVSRGNEGIHHLVLELLNLPLPRGVGIVGIVDFAPKDNAGGSLGTHDRDLGHRPGEDSVVSEALSCHRNIRATVRFPHYQRDLGNGRLRDRVQYLGAVADNSAMFLIDSRQKTRYIRERDNRDIECVAEPDKPRRLIARVDIERRGEYRRLVGKYSNGSSGETRKPHDHVPCVVLMHLEEGIDVEDRCDYLAYVVGASLLVGHDLENLGRRAIRRVTRVNDRRLFLVTKRQVR